MIDLAKQRYTQWEKVLASFTLVVLPMNLSSVLNLFNCPNPLPPHSSDGALQT